MKGFESSGVDFVVEPYIEGIATMYQRGEYFDRALITEQSWTHDGEDMDETSHRHKINSFALEMSSRGEPTPYVFLTSTEEAANPVYEETLPLHENSLIVVKAPAYTVNFFSFLIAADFDKFPSEIVYTPKIDTNPQSNGDFDDFGNEEPQYSNENPQEFAYDGQQEFGGNANNIHLSQNRDFEDPFENNGNPDDFGEPGFDDGFDQGGFGEQGSGFDDDFGEQNQEFEDGFGEPQGDSFDDSGNPGGFDDNPNQGFDDDPFQNNNNNEGFDDFQNPNQPNQFNGQNPEFGEFEDMNNPQDQGFGGQGDWENQNQDNGYGEGNPNQGYNDMPDYSGRDNGFDGYEIPNNGQQGVDPRAVAAGAAAGFMGARMMNNQNQGNPDNQGFDNYQPEQYPNDNGFDSSDYDNGNGQQDNYDPNLDRFYGGDGMNAQQYEMDESDDTADNRKPRVNHRADLSNKQIKATIDTFAARGTSIVVTGCGGCGTSTMAFNIANVLCNMGYEILLVDFDTEHKAQSYISKDNFESLDVDESPIMSAVNNQSSGINTHISIVRQGFHLLTMGMASDGKKIEEAIQVDKLPRFINLAKSSHNFVIYDVPFQSLTGHLKDVMFNADSLVLTVDASNWGITKAMLDVCNIGNDDVSETIFKRGQLLFNRYRGLKKVLGKKVKNAVDITVAMDTKVRSLLGDDPGLYFQNMNICGLINDDPAYDHCWFEREQYSDTRNGSKLFSDLVTHILMMN